MLGAFLLLFLLVMLIPIHQHINPSRYRLKKAPLFIQGVVGVSTLHTPWPMEQKMQVKQRINERMHMFHFVLEMVDKGKTTEEIAGLLSA